MSIIKLSKNSVLLCSFLLAACDGDESEDPTNALNSINGVQLAGLYADGAITDEEGNVSIIGDEFFSCRSEDQTRYAGIFTTEFFRHSDVKPAYFTFFSVDINGAYEIQNDILNSSVRLPSRELNSVQDYVQKGRDYCNKGPA